MRIGFGGSYCSVVIIENPMEQHLNKFDTYTVPDPNFRQHKPNQRNPHPNTLQPKTLNIHTARQTSSQIKPYLVARSSEILGCKGSVPSPEAFLISRGCEAWVMLADLDLRYTLNPKPLNPKC